MAKFYNIVNLIDKDYFSNNYLKIEKEEFDLKLENYIATNKNLNTGDILFVGSDNESRQGYGFVIVDKRNEPKWYHSEQGVDLVFENDNLKNYLIANNIRYKTLFDSLNKYYSELTGYTYCKGEVSSNYMKNNLG